MKCNDSRMELSLAVNGNEIKALSPLRLGSGALLSALRTRYEGVLESPLEFTPIAPINLVARLEKQQPVDLNGILQEQGFQTSGSQSRTHCRPVIFLLVTVTDPSPS